MKVEYGQNVLFYPKSGEPGKSHMGRVVEVDRDNDKVMVYVPDEKEAFEAEKIVSTYSEDDADKAVKDLKGTAQVEPSDGNERNNEPKYEGVPENQAEMNWRLMEKLESAKNQHIEDLKERLNEVKELQKKKEGRHRETGKRQKRHHKHRPRKKRRRTKSRKRRRRGKQRKRQRETEEEKTEKEEIRLDVTLPQQEDKPTSRKEKTEDSIKPQMDETSEKREKLEELPVTEDITDEDFQRLEEETKQLTSTQKALIRSVASNPKSKTKELFERDKLYGSQQATSHALKNLEDRDILDFCLVGKGHKVWSLSGKSKNLLNTKDDVQKEELVAAPDQVSEVDDEDIEEITEEIEKSIGDQESGEVSGDDSVENRVFYPLRMDLPQEGKISEADMPKETEFDSIRCVFCGNNEKVNKFSLHCVNEHEFNIRKNYEKREGNYDCLICDKEYSNYSPLTAHYSQIHSVSVASILLARLNSYLDEEVVQSSTISPSDYKVSERGGQKEALEGDNPLEDIDLSYDEYDNEELEEKLVELLEISPYSLTIREIFEYSDYSSDSKSASITQSSAGNRAYRILRDSDRVKSFKPSQNRYYYVGDSQKPTKAATESPSEKEDESDSLESQESESSDEEYIPHRSHLGKDLKLEGENPLEGLNISKTALKPLKKEVAKFTNRANRMASIKEMLDFSGITYNDSTTGIYQKVRKACEENPDIDRHKTGNRVYYYSNFTGSEDPETNAAKRHIIKEYGQREYEIRLINFEKLIPEEAGETTKVTLGDVSEIYGGDDSPRDVFEMYCTNSDFHKAAQLDMDVELSFRQERQGQSKDPARLWDLYITREE